MKKILVVFIFAFLFACGEQSPSEEAENGPEETAGFTLEEVPEPDFWIVPVDTIGVEIGDSNYVFGQIAIAAYFPCLPEYEELFSYKEVDMSEYGIAVLDMQKCAVTIFTKEGEFVTRVGRKGSGPGEFLLPSGMTFLSDGQLAIADGMRGCISFFNTSFEYEKELSGFFPSPPVSLIGVDNEAFVGMKPNFEQNEEGMFMGMMVARWEKDSPEPTDIYFDNMTPFDPTDITSSFGDNIVIFTAAPDGRIFTSPMTTEEYHITGYSADGEEILSIERPLERTQKTEEEIEDERTLVNARMIAGGMPPEMANWEPDLYRLGIAGIQLDGQGRLWVTRGTVRTPYFDVFDSQSGEPLFTAAMQPCEEIRDWTVFIFPEGILAVDLNPEDFPRVFILEREGAPPEQSTEGLQTTQ